MKLFQTGFKAISFIPIFSALLLCVSCTWVRLDKGAGLVTVKEATDVASCRKVGEATVKVVGKVLGISRNKEKMGRELEILAKNAAGNMKGDSVVSSSGIENGRQSFDIFKCKE